MQCKTHRFQRFTDYNVVTSVSVYGLTNLDLLRTNMTLAVMQL